MSDTDQTTFNQMSALLTGFSIALIAPALDPIGLPETFLTKAMDNSDGECANLLATFAALKAVTPALDDATIGAVLMGLADDPSTGTHIPIAQTQVAQAILKMWYLGSWYQPFAVGNAAQGTETVVSDQAYIKGLAWQAMQSHAMGNSTFTFGYWDKAPAASLADTTGNVHVSEHSTGWGASA